MRFRQTASITRNRRAKTATKCTATPILKNTVAAAIADVYEYGTCHDEQAFRPPDLAPWCFMRRERIRIGRGNTGISASVADGLSSDAIECNEGEK